MTPDTPLPDRDGNGSSVDESAAQGTTALRPEGPSPAGKWRKRPVVVHAWKCPGGWELPDDSPDWIKAVYVRPPSPKGPHHELRTGRLRPEMGFDDWFWRIGTLEGVTIASAGDWIIKGVKGEIYACKPDIFEQTYEPADQSSEEQRQRGIRATAPNTATSEQDEQYSSLLSRAQAAEARLGEAVKQAYLDGFLCGICQESWEDMHDWAALVADNYSKTVLSTLQQSEQADG